jgi:hypothetical protein
MTAQPIAMESTWLRVKDGNAVAIGLFRRHYSYNVKRNQLKFWPNASDALFAGPGEKLVLLTPCARALFVWRKFRSADGQQGVSCAIFRNEGAGRASDLIREADEFAWERWSGERLYTYVNDRKVRRSRTPGRCFLKAGWRYVRDKEGKPARTKCRRLLILECLPEWKEASR